MTRLLVLAALAVLAACGGGDDDAAPTTVTTTSTTAPGGSPPTSEAPDDRPDLDRVSLALTEVASLDRPLAMTWCDGRDEPLVAEKGGRVRALDGDVLLDLSPAVSTGNEQGLLGIACAPDGGSLFVSYTDRDGTSRLDELEWSADGSRIDREAGRTVLEQSQPAANHNGGNILFGPDGRLWYGLGDGGGADDRFDNAQDPDSLLGSMLRIDVELGAPEIVLKGLRNPWRFSFDRDTADLWIGDVGQGDREEIDLLPGDRIENRNLGWPAFEGTRRHRTDVEVPPDVVMPVYEYGHDEGQSVIGGYRYRGDAIPALRGAYLFADAYATWVRAIVVADGEVVAERDVADAPNGLISSFAEDPDGELYVLSLDGGVYRLDAG